MQEMQIKTTMRCHSTLVKMAKIKKYNNTKWWWRCEGTRSLIHCRWKCKWDCHSSRPFFKRFKHTYTFHITQQSQENCKFTSHKNLSTNVSSSSIHNHPKLGKKLRCPSMEEWVNKLMSILIIEYYSAIENNGFLVHTTTWMNLKGIMLGERRQSQKVTDCMTPFIHHSLKDKTVGTDNRSGSVRI